jgi:hypothetical protein
VGFGQDGNSVEVDQLEGTTFYLNGVTVIDSAAVEDLTSAPTGSGLEVDNYRELHYQAEPVSEGIENTGLTTERVKTRLELRLRSVGLIPVEGFDTTGYLYVRIHGVEEIFTVEVMLRREIEYILENPDVSGSMDGIVKVWDRITGEERLTLEGHEGPYSSVAISPDGRTIGSGGDGTIRLWDAITGEQEMILEPGLDPLSPGINPLAFAPDGRALASSDRGRIRLWDVVTGQERASLTLPGRGGISLPLAFVADGRTLVSIVPGFPEVETAGFILWDLVNREYEVIEGGEDWLSVAVTRDGRTVATGSAGGGVVQFWDLGTGTAQRLVGHRGHVWGLAFSPNEEVLASASWDGTVRLWDAATGKRLAVLQGLDRFYSVAFADEGRTLVAGGMDFGDEEDSGRIMAWDLGPLLPVE